MVQMLKISVDFEIKKSVFWGLNEVENSILFIKKFSIYSKMIIFAQYGSNIYSTNNLVAKIVLLKMQTGEGS